MLGIVYLVATIIGYVALIVLTAIKHKLTSVTEQQYSLLFLAGMLPIAAVVITSFIEAIAYLISKNKYNEKYNNTTAQEETERWNGAIGKIKEITGTIVGMIIGIIIGIRAWLYFELEARETGMAICHLFSVVSGIVIVTAFGVVIAMKVSSDNIKTIVWIIVWVIVWVIVGVSFASFVETIGWKWESIGIITIVKVIAMVIATVVVMAGQRMAAKNSR
jgi:hypothetical protein